MCPLHPHRQKWGEVEASLGKEGAGRRGGKVGHIWVHEKQLWVGAG